MKNDKKDVNFLLLDNSKHVAHLLKNNELYKNTIKNFIKSKL
jgi:hypothetical protein